MKFISTNRMVNGLKLIIRHPVTGEKIEGMIDTDKESASTAKYFQRLYKASDLEIVETKAKTKTKGVE